MKPIKRNNELWNPFDVDRDLQREFNKAFNRSLALSPQWGKIFEPDIDVIEERDRFFIKVDLPGLKKEELDIKVEGRFLTLKGERKQEKETKDKNYYACERFYGVFTRYIELPTDVKADQVKASYKDGVLEIELPKTEGAKAKQITVEIK